FTEFRSDEHSIPLRGEGSKVFRLTKKREIAPKGAPFAAFCRKRAGGIRQSARWRRSRLHRPKKCGRLTVCRTGHEISWIRPGPTGIPPSASEPLHTDLPRCRNRPR